MSGVLTQHIATRLYKIYNEGNALVGTGQLDLPGLSMMTQEIKGGDIPGTIDMPLTGLVQSSTATINLRTVTKDGISLMTTDQVQLEFRASVGVLENGKHVVKDHKLTIRGYFKNLTTGKLATGETQDRTLEFEVVYFKEIFDGEEMIEFDKLNCIYKVKGTDVLEADRNIIG